MRHMEKKADTLSSHLFRENNGALLKQVTDFTDGQMQVTDDNLAQLLKKTISKKV